MQRIGIWTVTPDGPRKVECCNIELEKQLEEWIVCDAGMLQAGLTIVGRQVQTEGGPLDLLGLNLQGEWVVIEIKRGTLVRETVAQALDYASCLARMPFSRLLERVGHGVSADGLGRPFEQILRERGAWEESENSTRGVTIMLVGTGIAPGLERMVEYLSEEYNLPIDLVSYQVFEMPDKQRILARELREVDAAGSSSSTGTRGRNLTIDEMCEMADRAGVGDGFRRVLEAARRHGLHARPYRQSMMYAPPTNKTRCLFVVWLNESRTKPMMYMAVPEAFAEFYPISPQEATSILGPQKYREMPTEAVTEFVQNLDELFAVIGKPQSSESSI